MQMDHGPWRKIKVKFEDQQRVRASPYDTVQPPTWQDYAHDVDCRLRFDSSDSRESDNSTLRFEYTGQFSICRRAYGKSADASADCVKWLRWSKGIDVALNLNCPM